MVAPLMPMTLDLSGDEALVLFELLQRFSTTGVLSIDDPAEQRLLWDLTCVMERTLVTPADVDYATALEQARARLRDPVDGDDGAAPG